MLNRTLIGAAVALTLNAPANEMVIGAEGGAQEGTVITKELGKHAKAAIKAVWNAHEKIVSASKLVLELAQEAVTEAQGDYKLALNRFDAACAWAAAQLREENKEAKGEEKARLDEFLADDGSWNQYAKNIRRALKAEFDILEFKTESSLRAALKSASDATKSRKTLRGKLGDKLDLSEMTDEQFSEACKAATGESGQLDEGKLEKELRKLGFVEPEDTDESDEARAERIYREAMAQAIHFMGEDERWKTPRESLAKLIVLLNSIPDDGGHEQEVNRALNNAYVTINRLYKPEQGTQAPAKTTERRVVDA
jgi:hypothetical protein